MLMEDLMIKRLIINPVIESSIGNLKIKVNINPNKTLVEMTTSLRILIAFAVSMELLIFFPCLYWYEASKSLPIIENIVT